MPRRIYDYSSDLHVGTFNMISTIGSFILGVGVLLTVLNVAPQHQARQAGRERPMAGEHAGVVHAARRRP